MKWSITNSFPNSQILFTGDLPTYVFAVTYIYFTLIRNTMSIYQACFPSVMSSAAVKWAKEHLEQLNAILVRQMKGSIEKGSETWETCLDILGEHEKLLVEVGLDFRGVVGRGLRDDEGDTLTGDGREKDGVVGLGLK